MATTQRPQHERPFGGPSTRTNFFDDPKVFIFRGYYDLVCHGIEGSRLTWHMLPNIPIDVLNDEGAAEFMDALLKQHEAEQRLRRYSAEFPDAEPSKVIQEEVIRLMLTRAEIEIEVLKRALNQNAVVL